MVNEVTNSPVTRVYKKKFDWQKLGANIFVYFMLFLMYAPIFLLIFYSFNDSKQIGRLTTFSFDSYIKFFDPAHYPQSAKIWEAIGNTAIVAIVSGILSTILGTVGAIGIFYSKKRIRNVMDFVTQIPVVNAEIVMALSLCMLFVFFKMEFSFFTLIVGHMILGLPFVVLSVQPKLAQMDPNLYEAAMDLGATPTQALFKVIIPEIVPGIISGLMLSLTLSLDDYVITAFTMPNDGQFNTISTYVEQITKKASLPVQLRAFTTILFVIILVIMVIYTIRVNKKEREK